MPRILFIHQNFPGQFRGLITYLRDQGWDVMFASAAAQIARGEITRTGDGIRTIGFEAHRRPDKRVHHYLHATEQAILNGQGLARMAIRLRKAGYIPDIVVAHSGWGSGSFARTIWPEAKFVQYLEWWYRHPGPSAGPAPDGQKDVLFEQRAKSQSLNLPFLLDIESADAVLMPTAWQARHIPGFVRRMTTILHDGVDCRFFQPGPRDPFPVPDGATIPPDVQVITYATRGMEPMRGFPQFMQALSLVQKTHPHVHAVIAGTDTIHYGDWLPKGETYKTRALAAWDFDHDRLHWTGKLPMPQYRNLLQRSDVHVYLTRPFVLSWSLTEAMATGCPLVVSDLAPLHEALPDDSMARFVDHDDIPALADAIRENLDAPAAARARGQAARERALQAYDSAILYPAHRDFFLQVLRTDPAPAPGPRTGTTPSRAPPPPDPAARLEAAQAHFSAGRISALWDDLTAIRAAGGVTDPAQTATLTYLTLGAALYGFGDPDAARRLNAGIRGTAWAPMRYRLALRLGDHATARRIRRQPGLGPAEERDFRCSMGLHLIWRHHYRTGFHFYQDRRHAIHFPRILPDNLTYHPVQDDPETDPGVVVLEQGLGETLLTLMYLKGQATPPRWVLGQPRLQRLVAQVLPGTRFAPLTDLPPELHGAPALCAADLIGRTWRTHGRFTPPGPLVTPRQAGFAPPLFGICWRGGSGQNRREERHIPLHLFLDLLPDGFRYVPLQFDITQAETALLARDRRCQAPVTDVTRDPAEVLALVQHLAGVISVDSANWHFAAAADVPFLALMNRRAHWLWGPEARAEWCYPTATTLPKADMSAARVAAWAGPLRAAQATRPGRAARPQPVPAIDRPLFVAGLPRSGTSLMMNILDRHGIWTGASVPANAANPRGFFENARIKAGFVKDLLKTMGMDPLGVNPLPPPDQLPILPDFAARLKAELRRQGYAGDRPWAFKDPKLTLLWPVFARAFPDALWLVPRRDPGAVTDSLVRTPFMRRHSVDPEYWRMFCAAYDQRLDALRQSGATVHEADTDALVAGDHSGLGPVLTALGLSPDPARFAAAIDPGLFRAAPGKGRHGR